RAGILLVPDHPRHRVIGAREGDVRLDSVALDVDVQAGIRPTRADPAEADLLETETSDRRNVPGCVLHARRSDAVAVGGTRADRLGHEDLIRAARGVGRLLRLLPGDPRPRL